MYLRWLLLALSASSVVARSAPPWPRDDVQRLNSHVDVTSDQSDGLGVFAKRLRREILANPSNIFWIHNHATPHHAHKKSKIFGKDDYFDGKKHNVFNKSFKIKSKRRYRRASPSTDAVDDDPAPQWIRKSLPKTNFITAREHRTEKAKQTHEEDFQNPSVKTNEIPEPSFHPRSEVNRNNNNNNYNNNNNNRNVGQEDQRSNLPNRRIIYYASLPEISSKPVDSQSSPRRYEPLPLRPKYPRESSLEESFARSKPLAVDRYRYNPNSQTSRYTIIDADPPTDRHNYPSREINFQDGQNAKYNKIPAPYRQNDLSRTPQQYYDSYARNRDPVQHSGGTAIRSEPYRDYNPRQPAPWSVQIGTRLTVKDDGRPMRREDGRPMRQDEGQRRFYVNSQEKPRYGNGDDTRSRYRLL